MAQKYNVGDKVRIKSIDWYNENKDEDGIVELSTYIFTPGMSQFCGKIMTIEDVFEDIDDNGVYYMEEIDYDWTDEMIECKVEEECPQDFIEKYCISCGTQRCVRTKEYLNGCPYYNAYMCIKQNNDMEEETKPKFKVGDKITNGETTLVILTLTSDRYVVDDNFGECGVLYFISQDGWKIVEDENLKSREDDIEKDMGEHQKIVDEIMDIQGIEPIEAEMEEVWYCPEGYIFKDDNGNIINTTKIVLEKKKKEYPKTYEECCEVLGIGIHGHYALGYESETLSIFQNLIIYRNAYWKIAGEEMGLGKPWEPDWREKRYIIYRNQDDIIRGYRAAGCVEHHIFEFPTAEMRDAFKENFDPEIEMCKELL